MCACTRGAVRNLYKALDVLELTRVTMDHYDDTNRTVSRQQGLGSGSRAAVYPDHVLAARVQEHTQYMRQRAQADQELRELIPHQQQKMGMPDGGSDKGDQYHHQTLYCNGRVSATTLMVVAIWLIFIACGIAAGYMIHMSNETERTALRVNVIADQFEATQAMQAIAVITNDILVNHIPFVRSVLLTVNHTASLAKTLTSSIAAIDPAGLMRNTSLAIQRMDDMINHYFKQGAIKLEIPLAPEHQP